MKDLQICRNVLEILGAIGDDPTREGLRDTPDRVSRMYKELFSGVGIDPVTALSTIFEEEHDQYQSVVILRDVSFYSMCEHHLLPFFGMAQIGYLPMGKVCGASKLVRALEIVSKRLQLQERLTVQLAQAIHSGLKADGVAIIIEAEHLCMTMRGVTKAGSRIVTSAVRGPFQSSGMKSSELLSMLRRV